MKKILTLLFCASISSAFSQNPLLIPDTINNTTVNLNLQNGTVPFYPGQPTVTKGINGNILGPTIIMNKGTYYDIKVTNQLTDTTTIHWHGMHVSSENDGGPHTVIVPGTTWNPKFTVLDNAATYWYHPHLHMRTNEHVLHGMAGMIIVRDNDEKALTLPRKYGVDDFPIVIQTKTFDASNQIVVGSKADSVVMVNATLNPALDVPKQVVRLRLLNGASQRVFNIGLSNNQTFHQIASDGGLLDSVVALTRLRLAPGERAEILVDFNTFTGSTAFLKSYASELPNGFYGAQYPGVNPSMIMNGYNPNPLNGQDFDVLQFNILSSTANPVTTIPTALVTNTPWNQGQANITRTLSLRSVNMGMNQLNEPYVINNVPFNMDSINYTIPLNNIEIWSITNHSPIAHPFHIHDVQFYILDRSGVPAAANERGRKDVVMIERAETVRFITKFEDFANDSVPYMYHCHMLNHEDEGMMGQFVVVGFPQSIQKVEPNNITQLFPNPSNGSFTVLSKHDEIGKMQLHNIYGQQVWEGVSTEKQETFNLQLESGMYLLSIFNYNETETFKIVIER
jgi:blue copper oxidase